jgi:formylglycine-generating enzyme required for sulfatase activity
MGSPRREPGRRSNETERQVELRRPFYVSRFQVTNREFREFRAQHLSGIFKDETLDLERQPVVRVTWQDAAAFCNWLSERDKLPPAYVRRGDKLELAEPVTTGYRLPTEAEWEFAARGGLDDAEFAWGDELLPDGRAMANFWQGEFPWRNDLVDGFEGTAPVESFPPNGYGLYEMCGNVWEWTTDWYQDHGRITKPCCTIVNPRGGDAEHSYDPRTPQRIPRRVMKGGSYLCAPNYCRRYRPAARMPQEVDTSTCHLGFRCIIRNVAPAGA